MRQHFGIICRVISKKRDNPRKITTDLSPFHLDFFFKTAHFKDHPYQQ